MLSRASNARQHILYRDQGGYLDAAWLNQHTPDNADVYLCGSIYFMESMSEALASLSRKEQNVYFEPFGPKMSVSNI